MTARVLITGAGSGIGRACAVRLAAQGVRVVLVGRRRDALEGTLAYLSGSGHSVEDMDVTLTDAISGRLQAIAKDGQLTGLVHAAGYHKFVPVKVLSGAEIQKQFAIDVEAGMALAKAFRHPSVRAPGIASIVFCSSAAALKGEMALASYSAAKGALLAMSRSLAIELAPERIRVNAIAAGMVTDTQMSDATMAILGADGRAKIEATYPLGFGKPDDVAHAIAFLLDARWVTGTTLTVDGGATAG